MSWVQNVQAVQAVQNVWNDLNYLNGWNSDEHRSIAFDPEGSFLDRYLPVNPNPTLFRTREASKPYSRGQWDSALKATPHFP